MKTGVFPSDISPVPENDSTKNLEDFIRNQTAFASYLSGMRLAIHQNAVHISFAHKYFGKWFIRHKKKDFESLLAKYFQGEDWQINYETRACALPTNAQNEIIPKKYPVSASDDMFSSFFINDKNFFPVAAARHAALADIDLKGSRRCRFSPNNYPLLVIRSVPGLGKTHLLGAIFETLSRNLPQANIYMHKAAFFCATHKATHNLILESEIFWKKYNLLILDDLQDIVEEGFNQNLLANYIDAGVASINESNKRQKSPFIFIFAMTPNQKQMNPALAVRLEKGTLVDLSPPDLDVRLRYIDNENRIRKLGLNREQILDIARNSSRISQISGLLQRVELYINLYGQSPATADLCSLLRNEHIKLPPAPEKIIEHVAHRLGLKVEDVLGSKRDAKLVLGRQIAMYICRDKLGISYSELGKIFGGKDHTTIMYGIEKIKTRRKNDPDMHKLLTEMDVSASGSDNRVN